MVIIGVAFIRTQDQYATFVAVVFLGVLWPVSMSIVVGDILEIWDTVYLRRRALKQAVADALS
jgi:hypothetical protein